ncbi:DUF4192 domain-containing protein [Nocardioides rotundus]|uniref:DUF4192 domain-containing protein n=1 Tax=Nocardioides rotundus TaxID=1774216 RepID=UPI001CBFE35B|nr:DUF4192 domain-containing protein [Nocardioides rotundus]UAL28309.1 DUF4192 domain-containing protein [Nocardioides rotundus]
MTTRPDPPLTLRAAEPEDALALVPIVLGFHPEESVTLLGFGGRPSFHARVGLPPDSHGVPALVQALLEPSRRHGVRELIIVIHAAEPGLAGRCAHALELAFAAAGIDVLHVLRADGRRWWPLMRGVVPLGHDEGVGYDVQAHPFLAAAVMEGRVIFGSREELARSLDPRPERIREVETLLRGRSDLPASGPGSVDALAARCREEGREPEVPEVAWLLAALDHRAVWESTWCGLHRSDTLAQLRLWTSVLVSAPPSRRTRPALLVTLSAWLAGNGALAWCAFDRATPSPRDARMVALVRRLLTGAVPPSAWDDFAGGRRRGEAG